jgi:hypothetical protein
LEVDRFDRHQCPLLENAAIALQQGHVAMGQEETIVARSMLQRTHNCYQFANRH